MNPATESLLITPFASQKILVPASSHNKQAATMKAPLLALFFLIILQAVHAFAPASQLSTLVRTSASTSRPQRHVAYMRFPRLPFLKKREEGAVTSAVLDEPVALSAVEISATNATTTDLAVANEGEMTETEKLLKQVKDAGLAGVISYASWELAFWAISVPVVLFGYYEVTGHWPDLADKEDVAKLGAEAFAFVNFARFAVPLRIGLALSTTPWIQDNIVDRFLKNGEEANGGEANGSSQ